MPEIVLVTLYLLGGRPRVLSGIAVIFVLGGATIAAQHLLASTEARPHFQAAEWITANIDEGETIYVREKCEPFRYPPLDLERYRVAFLSEDGAKEGGYVLEERPNPERGTPIAGWTSSIPYFRTSFAEQQIYIYRIPPVPRQTGN